MVLYVLFVAVFLPYLYVISSAWSNSEGLICSKVVSPDVLRTMKENFNNMIGAEKHEARAHDENFADWGLLPNHHSLNLHPVRDKLRDKR